MSFSILQLASSKNALRTSIVVSIFIGAVICLMAYTLELTSKVETSLKPTNTLLTDDSDMLNRIFVSEALGSHLALAMKPASLTISTISSFGQDQRVTKAEEAVRSTFNTERSASCKKLPVYRQPGTIQYLIRSTEPDGSATYLMEILFGNEAVFARVMVSANNTAFKVLSSTPGPCSTGIEDQLAVSLLGEQRACFKFFRTTSKLIMLYRSATDQ